MSSTDYVWQDEDRLISIRERGLSMKEAARELDVTAQSVGRHWNKIQYAGLEGDVRQEVILLCSLRGRAWFKSKEIADALDESPQKIGHVLRRLRERWEPLEKGETTASGRWWFNRDGGDS